MSKLELILLGQFECLLPSGTRISLSMRKAEVLLAYLALTPGLRHPRERLINLLWSNRGEEQARNSLRQCLSAIKKSLGDVADLVLLVDRTTVSLIPELIDIDVHEFERLAAEGDYESLTTAADLYHGEFLEGISIRDASCQEWLDSERGRFKRQFIEILANLAETQLISHDYGNAIRSAERLVKQDPLDESGWRLLMRGYFDNGDRSHALQAFKRCQQALRDELDVEPESTTIELRDRIASGESKPTVAASPVTDKLPVDTATSTDHSIAVLPFDNLSGDPEQEYFSDGITDSIILNLSLFPGLKVKSRNTSFAFRQQIKSLGEISKELNVDYIVEGSIRKSDQHIRITVQLIDAAEGNQIWGKRYEADLTDLFSLEEELSRAVAATVTGQIESELQRIAIAKGAADQQSYDLLLSGIYHNQRYNSQDTAIAIDKLNQCLAKDPDNVRALMWIYASHLMGYLGRWSQDYLASFELAAEHIHKAMALAPESSMVQVFYAQYLVFCGEFEKAEKHLDKALEINPNDPTTLTTMALNLEIQGKAEDALRFAERACLLDPYHPWAEWEVVVSQFLSGQYENALKTITKMRTSPGFIQIFGIVSNVKLGRIDLARQALRSFMQENRESMLTMPQTIDQWLQYTRENYPFADSQINRDIIGCMLQAGLEDETASHQTRPQSDDHSIAVLPFDNLSGDPAQEYFSDGISESIILNLSLFPGLKVKSRNSSFAFKQQLKSPGEISRELAVDYVLEGSLRKTRDRIRITVQLIDAGSEDQIWGKRYDSDLEDLFDLEEELSRSIAATVTGQIESDLQRIAIARGAAGQESYDLLLSGIYHAQRFTGPDTVIAIDKLSQCLAKDPDNVRAHVYLYICHSMSYLERWIEDYQASAELASQYICKALALGPDIALVQAFYAEYLTFFQGQLDQAMSHLNKALEINPNDTDALTVMSLNLDLQGNFEAGLKMAERTYQLDPYHPWIEWELAGSQYFSGRYQEALDTIANASKSPSFTRIFSITANIKLGRADAARKALEIFLQECRQSMLSMPKTIADWTRHIGANYPFKDTRHNQDIIDCMLKAGLEEQLSTPPASGAGTELPSILVLPFSNLSGDPEQEYFSDGITDSIIVSLSSFSGLKVKSRHTSIAFKDSPKSSDEIGAELGVQYIVEGTVRKLGENVRITVQLGDTGSGNQVWGKRYDSPLEDLFTLEEVLVQTVANTVSGRIEHESRVSSLQKSAADLRSYDYLMRGTHHLEKFNADDSKIAKEQLAKCLEIDPRNTEAHTQLAVAHSLDLFENWTDDRQRSINACDHHLQQAIKLEPENAYTHAYLAEHQLFTRDFKLGLFHADRSIELNPTLPDGYSTKSYLLAITGQIDAALKNADISMQIDPYSYYMGWNAGEVYRMAGQYQRAVDTFRSIPHMSPSVHAETSACLVGLGQLDEARAEMKKFHQLAQQQMVHYPQTETAWRQYWYEVTPYEHDEDFEVFYDQLLQAGLCDDLPVATNEMPSVLVLPFENMSGDPEQAYFSNGITESIILTLSSSWGLTVKSRHTSFAYQNSTQSIREIGEELDVPYIVEGSIRKHQDQVRITVQLGESSTGNQIWGKRYDKPLDELFEVEEDLARNIAGAISGRIGREVRIIASKKPASDMKSFDHLMRGWYYYEQHNPEAVAKSIESHKKCIEIDPENVDAHAFIAGVSMDLLYENWSEDREQTKSEIDHYVQKALALDQNNAFTHAIMSDFLNFSGDYEKGLYHASRAIELDPTLPDGYTVKAINLVSSGNIEAAVELADFGMQLDQFHSYTGWGAGEVYRYAGDYEKAIEAFRTISNMPPSLHAQTAVCLVGLGRLEKAKAEIAEYLRKAWEFMPRVPASQEAWRSLWSENLNYQSDKDFDVFFEQLLQAGLCDDLENEIDNMPSIAVLPFENMSGDPEQEYFSDGITSSLILSLGLYNGLAVKSQNSSFAYKNSGKSSEEIAEALKVTYLVEGSIRKSASNIRISVQLIESASGNQIWGQQYDSKLEDVLDLEQELSQTIAATISGRIGHKLQQSAARKPAKDLQSYDYLMRGLYHLGKFSANDLEIAKKEFGKCLEIDPDNSAAHYNLGEVHFVEVLEGWTGNRQKSEELAAQHLETALQLEPDNALAHAYMADYLNWAGGFGQSEFHADKAIELNPTAAEGYFVKADLLRFTRRIEQAIPYADKSLQLDPHSVGAGWAAGGVYQAAGQYDKAIKTFRSISHPPASIHAQIAACFIGLGVPEEARKEMKRYQQLARQQMSSYPESEAAWRLLWRDYSSIQFDEDFDDLFDLLKQAGLCEDLIGTDDDMPSIAVLPFENMSGDPEQEHFSDGITADIISTLSKFKHLRTVSRYSTLRYKSAKPTIAEIAQQQNARYILEGSVRKSGNHIRVSAELIDSENEKICWSERYDRDLDDLFAVQDEITRHIALAMKVQLDDGEMALHRSKGTSNIKAWELAMSSVDLAETYIRRNILEARALAREAIELDPDYAYAWIALGWTYWQEAYSGWGESIEELIREAERASQQAFRLDPDYSEAWSQLGLIHLMKHEPDKAIEACRRAVALEPGSAEIQALSAFAYLFSDDYEQAQKHNQNMLKLCPIRANWYYLIGAQIELSGGNLERAIELYRQGIQVEPDSPLCRFYLVNALMEKGDEAAARKLADEIRALDSEVNGKGLAHVYAYDSDKRNRFKANLAKFDLA